MSTKETVHNMKKIVLHLHLDGSLRPETVQNWYREEGEFIPLSQIKEKLIVSKTCKNLNEYIDKFDLPLHFLQSAERIKEACFELFEDLTKRNVIYAEIRFAPSLHLEQGLTYEQVVEAAIAGMNDAKNKYGIEGSLILCAMRGDDNHDANIATIEVAKKYLGKGVCGVDLAGAEALYPTKNFKDIFALAESYQIPFTIHAGEADGAESIKTAVRFGAKRIGHGIRCLEDKELMKKLKFKQILLEICPTSNFQTQAINFKKASKHPIEAITEYGILVGLNTDNDTVSNTNIEQEYEWVLNNTSITEEKLIQMNLDSLKASFASNKLKDKLEKEIKK